MGSQGEALAAKLDEVTNQLSQTIQRCNDDQWRKLTAGERWSVGVTAHHAAGGYEPITGIVQSVATGQGYPPITMEMLDQMNAQHAQEFSNCTKQEALELLSRGSATAAAALRGLSDDQLSSTAPVPMMNNAPASAAKLAEIILIGHPHEHLASMQATM